MADTGAPWNLPYPLATDLVRDGAQAIEDLAEAVADGLDDLDTAITNIPVLAGIGANVQRASMEQQSVSSTSYVNTDLSVAITPTSTDALVLVLVTVHYNFDEFTTDAAQFRLMRGTTQLSEFINASPGGAHMSHTFAIIDNPSSAASVTYQVQAKSISGNTIRIGRTVSSANRTTISTIVAAEVAA